jgi:hypothetical protein
LNDPPSSGGRDNQDAGSNCENGSPSSLLKRFSQPSEIIVAGAAGAEVVEPFLSFRQRHLAGGDFLENFSAWTPDTVRVRELLEQTTA